MEISVSSAARSLLTQRGREEQRSRDDRRSRCGADQRMTCRCWCCLLLLPFVRPRVQPHSYVNDKEVKEEKNDSTALSVSTSTLTTQRLLCCRLCIVLSKNCPKITVSKRNNNKKLKDADFSASLINNLPYLHKKLI